VSLQFLLGYTIVATESHRSLTLNHANLRIGYFLALPREGRR
jgi:hypothetical protein